MKIIQISYCITLIINCLICASASFADQQIWSSFTNKSPKIDGFKEALVWERATSIMTKDGASDIDITLRSVYDDSTIYFLVTFADTDESRNHRSWIWNKKKEVYEVGPDREDCFVFKWFIGTPPNDIGIDSDDAHTADTWFWKANRTDPVGYADDKIQRLTNNKEKKSMKLMSRLGKTRYLQRKGDWGEPAYLDQVLIEYKGPVVDRFENQMPSGSRADIVAKGHWENGLWTIEFARRLNTGHSDDIQFDIKTSYIFGVSRYEVAGREPDHKTTQPLYGAGRLSKRLRLGFLPPR